MEYKECIRNIHRYLWYKIIRNTGTAFGGRPIGSVFLIILYHKYLWIFLIHSLYFLYIYIYPRYVPCISPCVFLNLWSQEKTSPYRKTMEILFSRDFIPFRFFIKQIHDILTNSCVLLSKFMIWPKSWFGHVRTYCWLNELRNTQGKTYFT